MPVQHLSEAGLASGLSTLAETAVVVSAPAVSQQQLVSVLAAAALGPEQAHMPAGCSAGDQA